VAGLYCRSSARPSPSSATFALNPQKKKKWGKKKRSLWHQVTYLDGRKLRGRQEAPRWVDAYTVPGQFIRVQREAGAAAPRLYALANSPYAAKRESANLDASIVEARAPDIE